MNELHKSSGLDVGECYSTMSIIVLNLLLQLLMSSVVKFEIVFQNQNLSQLLLMVAWIAQSQTMR